MVITKAAIPVRGCATDLDTIGKRVEALRLAKKWSQRQLGAKAGTSGAYISQLEAGKMPRPGVELLRKIAAALGTPLEVLTGGVELDGADYPDATIESINANLLTMRELSPEELEVVDTVVKAMLARLQQRQREDEERKQSV